SKVVNEEKQEILKNILGSIFTSVKHYKNGYDNLVNTGANYEFILRKSIEDDQFFDFYFTFEKNRYMILNDKIEEVVLSLNPEVDKNLSNSKFVNVFDEMDFREQVQFFKNIRGYIRDMDSYSSSKLVQILYSNSSMYDDKESGIDLTAYTHAKGTVAEIIKLANTNELKKALLEDVIKECVDLEFVRGVLYFAEGHAEKMGYEYIVKECKSLFQKKLQKKYIDLGANIFVDNQKRYGMWVLMEYIDNTEEVIEYYYKLIEKNPRNIIKFLSIFQARIDSFRDDKLWKEIRFNDRDFNMYFDKEKINEYVRVCEEVNSTITEEEKTIINLFKEFYNNNREVYLTS
ncbi:hypothetical protein, partial [Bacillus cereus]